MYPFLLGKLRWSRRLKTLTMMDIPWCRIILNTISGDNSLRVPPVPIPNTEVKPQHAESTWLETAREDRSPPDSIQDTSQDVSFLIIFCGYILTVYCIKDGYCAILSEIRS